MKLKKNSCENDQLSLAWKIILPVLPILTAVLALGIGRMSIAPSDVIASAAAHLTGGEGLSRNMEMVLWNIRLPRILLALFVGAGLSAAGCAFQSLFSNPLATPDTLGVASGAAFGAALGILLGFHLLGVQAVSFVFGIVAVVLTAMAGYKKRQGGGLSNVVLAGIMIGSLFSALISLVKFTADTESELPAST